ncbi:hypothetical protein [Actinomadura rugatobispora]|uniref:Uncharacterized protein n=1 Tax=Actinomadura rugatobispora TaxID=1994 RepID=A0ABW1A674_9ACTN|nr:hypothetical protein GCM10010200_012430 [Actinomadura rugatobispora]
MRRAVPDLSTTQLAAGGLATLAAAVGASFLGVYGTIIGAAFMSVASTAGAAVCKHFLDQGRTRLKERAHPHGAGDAAGARAAADRATSADPTRTVVWPGGYDGGFGGGFDGDGDPGATRFDLPPDVTRADRSPAETVADDLAAAAAGGAGGGAGRDAAWRDAFRSTLDWARRRWAVLAVSSVAVFAVVMAGITVIEKITDRPASGWVGANDGRGTTWGNLGNGGGGSGETPAETPSPEGTRETSRPSDGPSSGPDAPESPAPGPSREPTSGPTGDPGPGAPSQEPTSGPTAPPTPQPTQPTGPGGGEQDGGGSGSTPDPQAAPGAG